MRIYILLCIYTFSCIGLMVDFHYCGGELVSITFYQADEDGCCGEEQEEDSGCCKDKYLIIDTDDSENIKSYTLQHNNSQPCISPAYHASVIVSYNNCMIQKNSIPLNHAPPNVSLEPLFIKNSILLI